MLLFLRNRVVSFLAVLIMLLSAANIVLAQAEPFNRDRLFKSPPEVDKAIDKGLDWLLRQQDADGSWLAEEIVDLKTKQPRPRLGRNGSTALAMLGLLAQGYSPGTATPMDQALLRGQKYLLQAAQVTPTKDISWIEKDGGQLSHALCTIMLCEQFRFTNDKELLPFCQGAIKLLESNADRERHGWGLQPGDAPDLEVTYWNCEALRCAKMSYLTVDHQAVRSIVLFLNRHTDPLKIAELPPTSLAIYLEARINLGWKEDNIAYQAGRTELLKYAPSLRDPTTNYYVGKLMTRMDKETDEAWHKPIPALLVQGQLHHGPTAGSWPPGETSAQTRLGQNHHESTCLALMTITLKKRVQGYIKRDRPVDDSFPL